MTATPAGFAREKVHTMNSISVIGTLSVKDDKFILKVGTLEYPLTLQQFAEATRGAVEAGKACPAVSDTQRCKKLSGHEGKHHYRTKEFKKRDSSPPPPSVPGVDKTIEEDGLLSEENTCTRGSCTRPRKVGSKLCVRHYRGVMRSQEAAVQAKKAAAADNVIPLRSQRKKA
jgi:hypothetical protein